MSTARVNWRQAAGEALLIVLGVAAALAGQAWWEYRTERNVERHLVEGIRRDLAADSADLAAAIRAAETRAVGADALLQLVGDVDAGVSMDGPGAGGVQRPDVPAGWEVFLAAARARFPVDALTPREALRMLNSLQRLDLSDATYREATSSGQVDVIRDLELRAAVARYYFDAQRLGGTTDDRVDANAEALRIRLADAGLSPEGAAFDEPVLAAVRDDPRLRAELRNVRGYAIRQIRLLTVINSDLAQLAAELDDWIQHRVP